MWYAFTLLLLYLCHQIADFKLIAILQLLKCTETQLHVFLPRLKYHSLCTCQSSWSLVHALRTVQPEDQAMRLKWCGQLRSFVREHGSLTLARMNVWKLADVTLLACVSGVFSSESAERLFQSPGEFRGAAGAGQPDAVLLSDGRLHSGNWPSPLLMSCCSLCSLFHCF